VTVPRPGSELRACYEASGASLIARRLYRDALRFSRFSQNAPHVFSESVQEPDRCDDAGFVLKLARQSGVEEHRDAMFAGDAVNSTEQRPAMHYLLRYPNPTFSGQTQPAINM